MRKVILVSLAAMLGVHRSVYRSGQGGSSVAVR
jgi:hypothetical protein